MSIEEEPKKSKHEHYDVSIGEDGKFMENITTPLWQKIYKVPYYFFKYIFWERWRVKKREIGVGDFLLNNKRLFIIVCDPQTDKMIMGYKGKICVNKIINDKGKSTHVVRKMLKHSQFNDRIDQFLNSLSESIKITFKEGNHFFHWIDAGIYKISKSLSKNNYEKSKKRGNKEKHKKRS